MSNIASVIAIAFIALAATWFFGKRSGRKESIIATKRASEKAEKERVELDAEINADTNLVARAHASGVVRKS